MICSQHDVTDAVLVIYVERYESDHGVVVQKRTYRHGQAVPFPLPLLSLPHELVLLVRPGRLLGSQLVEHRQRRALPVPQHVPQLKRALHLQHPLHARLLDQVALAQHVDVRELQGYHGAQRQQATADELGGLGDERGVDDEHADHLVEVPPQLQLVYYLVHHGYVRVQLYLPGAVQDQVLVVVEVVEILLEPVHVLQQVLHAVYEATVGTELQLFHDIVNRYQVSYIKCHVIFEVLCGGVEVDDVETAAVAAQGQAVLLHCLAVCRFARARRPGDQLDCTSTHPAGVLGVLLIVSPSVPSARVSLEKRSKSKHVGNEMMGGGMCC
mmetsp:Transcript_35442/g.81099  ORF Transcript_35442/g.81099 Transcript_35442/m.81099 type:complete len:326 (+) Transcript_35442:156-1133(+)